MTTITWVQGTRKKGRKGKEGREGGREEGRKEGIYRTSQKERFSGSPHILALRQLPCLGPFSVVPCGQAHRGDLCLDTSL